VTGYGYIERGEPISRSEHSYRVERFLREALGWNGANVSRLFRNWRDWLRTSSQAASRRNSRPVAVLAPRKWARALDVTVSVNRSLRCNSEGHERAAAAKGRAVATAA